MPSFSITDSWHSKSGEIQKNSTADEGDEKEVRIICLIALPKYTHFPVTWLLMRNEAKKGGSTASCSLSPLVWLTTLVTIIKWLYFSILVHGVFSIAQCWKFCATPFISIELHYFMIKAHHFPFSRRQASVTPMPVILSTCLLPVKDEWDHLKIFSHVAPNRRALCKS